MRLVSVRRKGSALMEPGLRHWGWAATQTEHLLIAWYFGPGFPSLGWAGLDEQIWQRRP